MTPKRLSYLGRVSGWKRCSKLCDGLEKALGEADCKADEERMNRLRAAAKERGDGVANGAAGGGGGTAVPEMSSDVPFAERTEDGDDAMEIDGEDVAKTAKATASAEEAAAMAEEEEYRLRALDFSSLHSAAKVRENDDRGGRVRHA